MPLQTGGQGIALPAKHLKGTPGARDVDTPALQLGTTLVQGVIDEAELGVIAGPAGTGKSFIWLTACATAGVPVVWWDPPQNLSVNGVRRALLERFGAPFAIEADSAELDRRLRHTLGEFGGLLVVEEAKRLGYHGLEELRYLHCQREACWSLLLVGSELSALLRRNPALDSRIARRIKVPRLGRRASMSFARRYHPVYAEADRRLLETIEDQAHGVARVWARTLEMALKLMATHGEVILTPAIVAAALGATRGLEL